MCYQSRILLLIAAAAVVGHILLRIITLINHKWDNNKENNDSYCDYQLCRYNKWEDIQGT